MASIVLPTQTVTDATSDVGILWKAAVARYENITMTKVECLPRANNADMIIDEIYRREAMLKAQRHDGSKLDKFRSLINKSLSPIEKIGNIVASAASTSFPPSTAIFSAVSYLIQIANSVSADYDKITGLFEDLALYLNRLKILENKVPLVQELEMTLIEVLISVLLLCGISAKYVRMKRIVKAYRNLISGEDDELSTAYTHFHKMVEQEQAAVAYATLAAVGQIQKEFTTTQRVVKEGLALSERTELNTKALMAGTERLQRYLEGQQVALEHKDILGRLSSLDFHKRQRDVFAQHHQGTGQWLLESDEFQQWFKGSPPSILWCPGIPGAGKTVLTSLAVNYVQETIPGDKIAIAYVYCDYKNPETQSELELLSSISRQLAEQIRFVPPIVREFCNKNSERRRNPTGDEWILLITSLFPFFQTTYIFIDALDECPESNRENFLYLLTKIEPFVWLFITSRPHVDIQAQFPNKTRMDISASDSDIEIYSRSIINTNNRLSLFAAKDIKLEEDIVRNVSQKTAGMFLLAYLQMDHISRQTSLKSVRNIMKKLPTKVFTTYKEAMERIEEQEEEDRELARRALSYIFCARRPLTAEELCHSLAVEAEDTELDATSFPEVEILLNISAGLIRIDEQSGIVGLVHYTLQEYLEKNPDRLLPEPEIEIGKACLTYLLFNDFQGGPCNDGDELQQRLQEYRFLDYASHHWGYHIRENQLHKTVMSLVLSLLTNENKLASFAQILHLVARRTENWHDHFPKQFGPLHVVAYLGLEQILIVLFEKDIDVDIRDSSGTTALQLAAKHGRYVVAQQLLKKGPHVNIVNENGETALYWAARNGYKAIVELLLAEKASVLVKDNEGWTALDWAVVGGNNDVVKMLLQYGTDIANSKNDGKHKSLYLAAEEGHDLTVQMLLENGADINAQDSLGSTALDFATAPGHETTVQLLLRSGADVTLRDVYGNTVLHWATLHKKIAELLLEYGADINAKNDSGQTPLSWTAQDGPAEIIQLLLDNNANVNEQDIHGFTALHRATVRGREAMARLLLQNGSDPNMMDKDKWTPLHVAIIKQHEGLVQLLINRVNDGRVILDQVTSQVQDTKKKWLLEETAEIKAEASTVLTGLRLSVQERQIGRTQLLLEKGADINEKDIGGSTALGIAAYCGYEELVKILLENGADSTLSGYDRRTALHWACELGNDAIVQILVKNGADSNASAFGWTPLLLAVKDRYMSIVRFLVENGADVHAADYHGRTALHWAAKHGDQLIVWLLLQYGADVNAIDRWVRTPLIYAVEYMRRRVVQKLLRSGAEVEVKTRHDLTALHIATFVGFGPGVLYLLDRGANIEAKSRDNLTALHIAIFMGWELIIQDLLDRGADVEAEAQWCGAENGDEDHDHGMKEVDAAEKSLISLLRRCSPEEGVTDGRTESGHGMTARQLAAAAGLSEIPEMLR